MKSGSGISTDIYNRGYPGYQPVRISLWKADNVAFLDAIDTDWRHIVSCLCDGKHVMLKLVFLGEGPHELIITQSLSSQELGRDPRSHCTPLLDTMRSPKMARSLW